MTRLTDTPSTTVILGAGPSGLHTALRLQEANQHAVVYEARSRVGGRLMSPPSDSDSASVDLGATWVWPGEPRIGALLEELGLARFPQYEQGTVLYDLPTGIQRVPGRGAGLVFLRVEGGTSSITQALAARLAPDTLHLNATAVSVEQVEDRQLRVGFADGDSVLADSVVLCLPPTLVVANLEFSPPLPETLQAVARATPVWMGDIVKTVVVYESPFWRERGFSGMALSQVGPLLEIHDHCGPDGSPAALFGFSRRVPSDERSSLDQPPSPESVLSQLVRLFGEAAGSPREVITQDWSEESLTSPVGSRANAEGRYDLFGHSAYATSYFGGRLWFAGCETSGGQGHIEDALEASSRAVRGILESVPW